MHRRGRPRGGLCHEWGAALAVLKRLYQALKERRARLAWAVAEGVIGAGIGLGAVSLWLWSH